MASRKNKKRQHSRTVELKRQMEQEKQADEKSRNKKRMDPTARALLYGDLVFLAIASILETNELVSKPVGGLLTLIGLIILIVALWIQFRPKDGGLGKGPRL